MIDFDSIEQKLNSVEEIIEELKNVKIPKWLEWLNPQLFYGVREINDFQIAKLKLMEIADALNLSLIHANAFPYIALVETLEEEYLRLKEAFEKAKKGIS